MLQRVLAIALLLPLTLACRTAFAAAGGASPAAPTVGLLPAAKGPIDLPLGEEGGPSLAEVLVQLSATTGVEFTASEQVHQMLRRASCGLLRDVSVPAEQAWKWTESMLEHEGFLLGLLTTEAPYLVAVYPALPTPGRANVRASTVIAESQLELLAEHPVMLVSMTLDLPHIDVRQLANSLRGLTTDPTGQQNVVPVGNSNSVILTGSGRSVFQLATLLREIDTREAAAQAQHGQEGEPEGIQGEVRSR